MRTMDRELDEREDRAAMNEYLDNYNLFCKVCKERNEDLSSMEMAILHLGYVSGGQQ